jgi:uncharacterized protein YjbI with pentapeptide repeats
MTNLVNYLQVKIEDKVFEGDVNGQDFAQHDFNRVRARNVVFTDSSFKQALLRGCYFRNSMFIRCDFTGAHFKGSNLRGARFRECKFHYAVWEKTQLDDDFLASCLPAEENLARDLVRSLRVNFAEIGNYEAVNRAAAIEVGLTGRHLYNAAYSRQVYYRQKYQGLARVRQAIRHAGWKFLDLLWGNGESLFKVARSGAVVVVAAAATLSALTPSLGFLPALELANLQFWGAGLSLPDAPGVGVALIVSRSILFGLFMAILVKRLSRR